ncbi:MAG: tetratricopeptide repeat protein [Planctomycetes bacterium]|nr:tetratricopeptide repeat protein [Planctomycetota bacterium]
MGAHFQRGNLLFQQERHELAAREFELELVDNPNEAHVHALLALCRRRLQQNDRAAAHARRAIQLAPDTAFVHYVQAQVDIGAERFPEALRALDEAVRLDPDDAPSHALRGAVLLRQEKREEALAAAEKALEIDAEEDLAANIRAAALVALGRVGEARVGLGDALERRPESAFTHANQGWTLLHDGDHRRAIEHFGEALRLDPTDGWAKDGMLTALKARYVVYRWMLVFFLWQSRLTPTFRWGLIFGAFLGVKVLRSTSKQYPAIEPFVTPVVIAYAAFVFFTWTASALFDMAILCHRGARHLLTPAKRVTAMALFALVGVAAAFGIAALALRSPAFGWGAAGLVLCILPTSLAGGRRAGWPRASMSVYAGAFVAAVIASACYAAYDGKPSLAFASLFIGIGGAALSTWVGNFLPRDPGHSDG